MDQGMDSSNAHTAFQRKWTVKNVPSALSSKLSSSIPKSPLCRGWVIVAATPGGGKQLIAEGLTSAVSCFIKAVLMARGVLGLPPPVSLASLDIPSRMESPLRSTSQVRSCCLCRGAARWAWSLVCKEAIGETLPS